VGGTASNIAVEANIKAKFPGILEFEGIRVIDTTDNDNNPIQVVMGRTGEIRIMDETKTKVLITNHVPYGAFLKVKDGQKVEKGDELCFWDPYNAVILSEFDGTIEYEAIIEGVTYKEESDEQTGHREKVITETRDKTKNPTVVVKGKTDTKGYSIPVGAHLAVDAGEKIKAGQVLAKIPRTMGKSRDITGGLPRVTELFEARNPSNPAVVSEIDGVVTYGGIKRGNREIFIESRDGVQKRYLVPLSKHILVQDNDFVKAGQPLSDGSITPSDILSIKGPTAVQEYLVNEIQEVYRLQGVKINDKHIEAIVSQMMQKVEIIDPGDTSFLPGERRKDAKLADVRDAMPAVSRPTLQGITQASLKTESWLSAASFQETTKVLSEAAIRGKADALMGMKENVIVGHLIPAGTGQRKFADIIVTHKDEYENLLSATERTRDRERELQD